MGSLEVELSLVGARERGGEGPCLGWLKHKGVFGLGVPFIPSGGYFFGLKKMPIGIPRLARDMV